VERTAPAVTLGPDLRFHLHRGDFTTAVRIADAVNQRFGAKDARLARAENAAVVTVHPPKEFSWRLTDFVAELESLAVEADRPARVIVNERTGTVVLGGQVRIAPVAILHGNLTVEVQTSLNVSQPAPLSSGKTETVPQTSVAAKEEKSRSVLLKQGATVEQLVRALAAIGSTPRDVIAILQNLRSAGALEAEIEVI
jgi:flagellar P-ring protein FlgI